MRITGGNAARRILKVPKGLDVRPTPDLVKQAVFNSLGARVVGAKVLELFAGSGALSLECLSRGAASVICIEKSHRHAEFIRSNATAAGYGKILEIRTQDVFPVMNQLAEGGKQFDLILADASASSVDDVDAVVDALRSGGMLIFDQTAVSAAVNGLEDISLAELRKTIFDHNELVVADIDWSSGLLIATKRP